MEILNSSPDLALVATVLVMLVIFIIGKLIKKNDLVFRYFGFLLYFVFVLSVASFVSIYLANFLWAIFSFIALREYISLLDIRLQDRYAILAAYLSIPFMLHFVTTGWYNMFIISVPVYGFLVVPLLVALGGEKTEGAVASIGAIDFGLFFLVYCVGHIAYLAKESIWVTMMLIFAVTISDLVEYAIEKERRHQWKPKVHWGKFCVKVITAFILIMGLNWLIQSFTGIALRHQLGYSLIIPCMVLAGNYSISYFSIDLGISREDLRSGNGLILDCMKSLLFTAPVVYHYYRYFIQ